LDLILLLWKPQDKLLFHFAPLRFCFVEKRNRDTSDIFSQLHIVKLSLINVNGNGQIYDPWFKTHSRSWWASLFSGIAVVALTGEQSREVAWAKRRSEERRRNVWRRIGAHRSDGVGGDSPGSSWETSNNTLLAHNSLYSRTPSLDPSSSKPLYLLSSDVLRVYTTVSRWSRTFLSPFLSLSLPATIITACASTIRIGTTAHTIINFILLF